MTVYVSAHKGGAEDAPGATWPAYESAVGIGADYIEFDVRRTRDGELVVHHDPFGALSREELSAKTGYPVPLVRDVMRLIAGRARGHLDLKEVGGEREVVEMAIDILGADGFVATTLEDVSIARIKRAHPEVTCALALGRGLRTLTWPARARSLVRDLLPLRRIRACRADWIAVNHRLARSGVLRQAARHGLPAMVWTVNDDPTLRHFLADARTHVLITDRPRHALGLRA